MKLIYVSSAEEQFQKFAELLKTYSKSAIKTSDVFRVGLSGKRCMHFHECFVFYEKT